MKSLQSQLMVYQQQHTNRTNKIMHYIGIPVIIFALMMVFNWISLDIASQFQISFTWLLLAATVIYYFLLNARLALYASLIMIPMAFIATRIAGPTPTHASTILFLVLFVGGWILQFVGHFFEKQKPAFLISASQLLIGPLFVLQELLEQCGLSRI